MECKRQLWSTIHRLISSFHGEYILISDFNEVWDDSKRMGSQFHNNSARNFNNFIEQAKLIDIPLGGSRYTWSDKRGSTFSKLNHFLDSDGFQDSFLHISGMALDKNLPNHRTILFIGA